MKDRQKTDCDFKVPETLEKRDSATKWPKLSPKNKSSRSRSQNRHFVRKRILLFLRSSI